VEIEDARREVAEKLTPSLQDDPDALVILTGIMGALERHATCGLPGCPAVTSYTLRLACNASYLLASVLDEANAAIKRGENNDLIQAQVSRALDESDHETRELFHKLMHALNAAAITLVLLGRDPKPKSAVTAVNCAILTLESGVEWHRGHETAEARGN
jgi:hypothetical protein